MTKPGAANLEAIVQEILQHLQTHPDATDKLEGISGWWLSPAQRGCDPALLLSALDELVARRLIARMTLGDGQFLYQSVARSSGRHRPLKP